MNIIEGKLWGEISRETNEETLKLSQEESLLIKRNGTNTWITHCKEGQNENKYRYIIRPEDNLYIMPILPDYPLVIKPDSQLSILPGMKMEAFVEVPLNLNIGAGIDKMEHSLVEIPLHTLSKSFFGNPENGEIAYFVESPLHEDINSYEGKADIGYSPISIKNRSNQVLNFERMILRVPNLSLFCNEERFFTSPVEIEFRGQEQISLIKIRQSPPRIEGLKQVSKPRKPIDKSIIKRSFYFVKSIYSG